MSIFTVEGFQISLFYPQQYTLIILELMEGGLKNVIFSGTFCDDDDERSVA
jgi:hypothetical protein